MILSSESLNNLNIVKIQYTDGTDVGYLLGSTTSPLYLLDSNLPPIHLMTDTVNVWSSGKNLAGKIGAIGNMITSDGVFRDIAGDWAKFSGCIDVRSKFLFSGSQAQKFTIKCMLVNRYGWDVSIAPELDKLANWVLPTRVSDGKGGFVNLNTSFINEAKAANNAVADLDKKKNFEGLLGLMNEGLDAVGDWVGDIYFLNMPQQFDDIRRSKNVEVIIGKYKFTEVYISNIGIETPRTFMKNEAGVEEPDHVVISLTIEGLRQTSVHNKPF